MRVNIGPLKMQLAALSARAVGQVQLLVGRGSPLGRDLVGDDGVDGGVVAMFLVATAADGEALRGSGNSSGDSRDGSKI